MPLSEPLPQERAYQQDLLSTLLRWMGILVPLLLAITVTRVLLNPVWKQGLALGQQLVALLIVLWCMRLVRRGDLRKASRTFLLFLLMAVLFYMVYENSPLRFAVALIFGLLTLLANSLEDPRLALRWTVTVVLFYAVGCLFPKLAGMPVKSVTPSSETIMATTLLVHLGLLGLLGRSMTGHFRAALRASEDTRQDLEDSNQKLEQQRAELQNFAYVVSHDLRAPLRALTNYSRFLTEEFTPQMNEQCRQYVDGITESAKHMDSLVVDLLEYARVGRTEASLSFVAVGALLERIVSRLQLRSRADITLPPDAPTLWTSELRLEQILSNLLENAVKFTRKGVRPAILVEWADRGQAWEFAVRDSGIGINPKHFEQIFGIFQRLHPQGEYEGTGIGLAIVKKAVEEHGGKVWVESTPGQGSIFRFTVPKQAGTPERPAA